MESKRFVTYIPREAFDQAMTSFFRAVGMINLNHELEFDKLVIQPESILMEADIIEETVN